MADEAVPTLKKRKRKNTENVRKEKAADLPAVEDSITQDEIAQIKKQKAKKTGQAAAQTDSLKQAFSANREAVQTGNVDSNIAVSIEKTEKREQERKPKWVGPYKETANVRVISRFDYQPDVCKDWKETGYCGYGDNCKFVHDRGDYKTGWELEKEWEEKMKREQALAMGEAVEDEENYEISDDDEFPFACFICRNDFVDPVVTNCGHYFCESCALQQFVKDQRCAACMEQTQGVFNSALRLVKYLKRKKEKEQGAENDEAMEEAAEDEEAVADKRNTDEAGWIIPGGN